MPLWQRCLGRGGFTVIVDSAQSGPEAIQAFGLSVFVPDHFADRYFADPKPGVGRHLLEGVQRGEPLLLNDEDLAASNSGDGLNVVVLHFGSRYVDYQDPRTLAVVAQLSPSFFMVHAGYRVRSILAETYGADAAGFAQQGPFNLLRDFAAESPEAFQDAPPMSRPCLVGLRRDWVHGARFYPLSLLFFTNAPRIWFSLTERRVLERAVMGERDDQIAESIGLSSHTVKKAWNTALARVGDVLPGVLPHQPEPGGVRGLEKRRHLLDYLRLHMEELRPYRKEEPTGRRSPNHS